MEKLKWQIHSETSVTQIMLWIIIWKLFGGWFIAGLAFVMIAGNVYTMLKSLVNLNQLDKNYFKSKIKK